MGSGSANFVSVALNPAIDRTVEVEELRLGEVVRGRMVYLEPAGKGVNVARTLAALGHGVTCTGFLGSGEASWFDRSLKESGVQSAFVRVAGTTRENLTYLERSGRETHIVEAGFEVTHAEIVCLRRRLADLTESGTWVLLTGRPAPGFEVEDFRALLSDLRARGARLAVDSSGEFLQAAAAGGVNVLKPNEEELSQLVGRELRDGDDVLRAARQLTGKIASVVVSLGTKGALCVTFRNVWQAAERDPTPAVSTVGCGDALLAGFVAGLAESGDSAQALRLAVACGGACARRAEAAVGSRREVEEVLQGVEVGKV